MAKTLSSQSIETTQTVEAWHVTQSIDAFTGTEAYNLSLSGSLHITGSIYGQPGIINQLTASYAEFAVSASHEITHELSSSHAISADTASLANTASIANAVAAPNIIQPFTNITSSGDISSSGTVIAKSGSFSHLVGNSPITIASPTTFLQPVTASFTVSASNGLFISSSLQATASQILVYDTSSGKISFSDFPIQTAVSGGTVTVGDVDSELELEGDGIKLDGSSGGTSTGGKLDVKSDGDIDVQAGQSTSVINFKDNSGAVKANFAASSETFTIGTNTIRLSGSGDISASGDLQTRHSTASMYRAEQGMKMVNNEFDYALSQQGNWARVKFGSDTRSSTLNFNDTSSEIIGVNLSGSISASNMWATRVITPDNKEHGIKADGEVSSRRICLCGNYAKDIPPSDEGLYIQISSSADNYNLLPKPVINIDLSGSVSASNAYALKLTSPDNNTFGIKASGEISSSKQLITSKGPDVEDLLTVLSPPSANFDDTGSAAVNVDLSGSVSASNAYALKLTSPDNNTFGIKADGSILSGDVSGSGVSTASFGTYRGDGSSLTGIETDPFPYTGSAIISGSTELVGPLNLTGSLIISGSTSPLISLPSVPTDAIIISGSNDRTRLHIYESVLNSSPIYTEGAGIKLVGGTAVGNQATLELSAVGSSNGGSNNEQTFIHSNQQLVIQAADDDAGKNIKFRGSSYGLDLTAATAGVTLAFITNGGGTVSELNMGNGTYIQADANGTYYKIGRSSTDWLNLSSTKATFAADVSSSSATSTASFGTYLGDGSQLTNTDPFPYTGDAVITGSLTISGSFSSFTLDANNIVLGENAGTAMQAGADSNVIIGPRAGQALTTGDFNIMIGDYAGAFGLSTGQKSIFIGEQCGRDNSGTSNVFLGYRAGRYGNSNANNNIAIGNEAMLGPNNTNAGTNNIALGTSAGNVLDDSNFNILIGYHAGYDITTGQNNILIGSGSVGEASISDQLRIGNSNSLVTISASLSTGDVIFASTASSPIFSGKFEGDTSGSSVSTENVITTTLTASGEISASDIYATNLYGADAVYHKDDANTGIVFSSDTIKLRTNNVESIHLSTTSNLFGNDQDPTIISGSSLTVDTSNTTITGSLNVTGSIEMALPSGSGASYQSFGVPGYFKTRFGQNDSDFEIYRDNFITLQFNNAGSDQIEGSILTDPSAGEIHVTVNNEGAYTYLDKQVSDGIFDIDGSFGNDEISVIYMRSPQDDSWPFYKITVISANATSGASITFLLEKFI